MSSVVASVGLGAEQRAKIEEIARRLDLSYMEVVRLIIGDIEIDDFVEIHRGNESRIRKKVKKNELEVYRFVERNGPSTAKTICDKTRLSASEVYLALNSSGRFIKAETVETNRKGKPPRLFDLKDKQEPAVDGKD